MARLRPQDNIGLSVTGGSESAGCVARMPEPRTPSVSVTRQRTETPVAKMGSNDEEPLAEATAAQKSRSRRCLKTLIDDNTLLLPAQDLEPLRKTANKSTPRTTITQTPLLGRKCMPLAMPSRKFESGRNSSIAREKVDVRSANESLRPSSIKQPTDTSSNQLPYKQSLHETDRAFLQVLDEQYSNAESEDRDDDDTDDDLPIKPSRKMRSLLQSFENLQIGASGEIDDTSGEGYEIQMISNRAQTDLQTISQPEVKQSPPGQGLRTPPISPSRSRLKSPSKTVNRIPVAPNHRPSLDAFWSPDEVNRWNDQHSPKKVLALPFKNPLLLFSQPAAQPPALLDFSDSEDNEYIPIHKSPEKMIAVTTLAPSSTSKGEDLQDRAAARLAVNVKKKFDCIKYDLATAFLKELDQTITDGEICALTASAGGVQIVWSKKLNTTAGRAHWRREITRPSPGSSSEAGRSIMTTEKHVAWIEVAEKVIDDEERLRNVIAHEFCHLANFMISKMTKEPHGASFKGWAAKVTKRFGHIGVEVTTKHSYKISYKYAWVCTGRANSRGLPGPGGDGIWDDEAGCGASYQRHSKSIDPGKQACGKCKGRLLQIRPKPRGTSQTSMVSAKNPSKPAKAKNEYQAFVSSQYKAVKAELGFASPMKDVMAEIGRRYRQQRGEATLETVVEKGCKSIEVSAVETPDQKERADATGMVSRRFPLKASSYVDTGIESG